MKNKEILKETELIKSIMKANHELTVANKNFEGAEDDLIDYYSYQIKAIKAKLNYLIKQVKKQNISLDMANYLKIDTKKTEAI